MSTADEQRIRIILTRLGTDWRASAMDLVADDVASANARGSGPGEALEQIGQELDRREAERLAAVVQAAGGVPLDDAERELYGNVATVVEVLEMHPDEPDLSTLELIDLTGLDGRATVAALEQATRDGVVVRTPGGRWRLASDDEAEAAR